MFVYRVIWCKR